MPRRRPQWDPTRQHGVDHWRATCIERCPRGSEGSCAEKDLFSRHLAAQLTQFNIDLEAGTVTCPAGQTTSDARPAKDHKGRPATMFYFEARTCEICPLRDRCTAGRGGRTIMVGRHHRRIEAARAAQGQPGTKALLRRRAKVERKIDHLQDLGMRKARYRGRRKTRLQALLAATVANFKRLGVLGAFQGASLAAA